MYAEPTNPEKRLPVPPFWRGTVADIEETVNRVQKGRRLDLGKTAGGRPIYGLAYGEQPPLRRTANYNSAVGAGRPWAYVQKDGRLPSLMLVGGVHGSEMEAIVALLNLSQILETGADLRGRKHEHFRGLAEGVRLTLVPCLNVDGRARVALESYVGESLPTYRRWMQGTRSDGTIYSWPEVKEFHPIEDVGFLGGYFNDQRVNPMHDDFFGEPSPEVKAIMKLADAEAPDMIILLHSAADSPFYFCGVPYLPPVQQEIVYDLAERVGARMTAQGLPYAPLKRPETPRYASGFNLTRALHHHTGACSVTFESNAGIHSELEERRLDWDQILDGHLLVFEELLRIVKEQFEQLAGPFFKERRA